MLKFLKSSTFIISISLYASTLCAHNRIVSNSAGVVERVLEREYESRPILPFQEAPILNLDIPTQQLDLCDEETIYVKCIQFKGNTLLSSHCLEKIAFPLTEKDISLGDINHLCLEIQNAYLEKGYFLTIAFAPDQDITEGSLLIEILEGTLGEIFVEGNAQYSDAFIAGFFTDLIDLPINYSTFTRAILLLNENPDLSVTLVFKKGSRLGTSDIILKVEDEFPLHAYLDHNNYGTSSVSLWRSGLRVEYGNFLTYGDQISITEAIGVHYNELNFTDVIYRVPLNKKGTKLELSYIYSSFHVSRIPELLVLELRGKSEISSIKLSQAIVRTKDLLLDGFVGFDFKQLKNFAIGQTLSFDKLRVVRFGFFADTPDRFFGRNIFEAYANIGIANCLGGLHTDDPRCSRLHGGGHFTYINFDYTHIQPLPKNFSLFLNAFFQFTSDLLPVGEQLFIGGVDTVRGYPSAFALGDYGCCTNLELRFPPPFLADKCIPFTDVKFGETIQCLAFFDYGFVANNGKTIDEKKHLSLTAIGAGLRALGPYDLELSLDIGFPLSHQRDVADATAYFRVSIHM